MTVRVQTQRLTYVSPAAATTPAVVATIVESATRQESYLGCEPLLKLPEVSALGPPDRGESTRAEPRPLCSITLRLQRPGQTSLSMPLTHMTTRRKAVMAN